MEEVDVIEDTPLEAPRKLPICPVDMLQAVLLKVRGELVATLVSIRTI